jgi:phage shock protein C
MKHGHGKHRGRHRPFRAHFARTGARAGQEGTDNMSQYNSQRRPGPFRARDGVILGVIKGLSDYFNLSVFWTRVVAVGFLLFTGIWPIVGLYLLAALLMKPEPVVAFVNEDDAEFYNSYTTSRHMALKRLKRHFDQLDRRLRRMEDRVTDKEFDWNRRFNQG